MNSNTLSYDEIWWPFLFRFDWSFNFVFIINWWLLTIAREIVSPRNNLDSQVKEELICILWEVDKKPKKKKNWKKHTHKNKISFLFGDQKIEIDLIRMTVKINWENQNISFQTQDNVLEIEQWKIIYLQDKNKFIFVFVDYHFHINLNEVKIFNVPNKDKRKRSWRK